MDLMNSLDADGNGKGESNLGDLETEKRGGAVEVYPSLCRVAVVKFTVAPLYIEFNSGVSVNSTSRVTYAEEGAGRKLTKMYESHDVVVVYTFLLLYSYVLNHREISDKTFSMKHESLPL